MKKFKKYRVVFMLGLGIYSLVRLINDTIARAPFWNRPWYTTTIEVIVVLIVTPFIQVVLDWRIKKFDKKLKDNFHPKQIFKEFLDVYIWITLLFNATMIPLTTFTDDGIQIYDVIMINTIPELCTLLYFGVIRSRTYVQFYMDQKLQIERLENVQLATELKFLKAQFHPHFLFNALNLIYFQMDESVEAGKRSLEKFSEMLRYQLYEIDQITFKKEIKHLQNYIDLQSMRHSGALHIQTEWDERLMRYETHPFLLLPLIENAFKYLGGEKKICIQAKLLDQQQFFFRVENSKNNLANQSVEFGGIGLKNLKRRLELLYPQNHELIIQDQEDRFIVSLKFKLHENFLPHHG